MIVWPLFIDPAPVLVPALRACLQAVADWARNDPRGLAVLVYVWSMFLFGVTVAIMVFTAIGAEVSRENSMHFDKAGGAGQAPKCMHKGRKER